jgi:uncharacterized protein (TIGR02598 family)
MNIAAASSLFRRERASWRKQQAFSLIEVVLAMGVFSFAFLSIVGVMAAGVNSVKNASTNEAITNINRNLRANIQATTFTNFTSGVSQTFYYTTGGFPTTTTATSPNAPFYAAVVTPTASSYPAAPTGETVPATTSANKFSLVVAISYPYPLKAQTLTNSIFIAQ